MRDLDYNQNEDIPEIRFFFFFFFWLLMLNHIFTSIVPCTLYRYIVLTTSSGILDHEEARRKHTGGKIMGFFY